VGLFSFPIAAGTKLAKLVGKPAISSLVTATILWFVPLTYLTNPTSSICITLASSFICISFGNLAIRQIKGINGDVMGAMVILNEIMLASGTYTTLASTQWTGLLR
jgi:cobalamin synthase